MDQNAVIRDTPAWNLYVWIAFLVASFMMLTGIWYLPVDLWVKGYFAMGFLFTVGSTFSLAKTIRDNFEQRRMAGR